MIQQKERAVRVHPVEAIRSIEQVLKDEGSRSLIRQLNVVMKRGWEIGESLKNLYHHREKNNSSYTRARARHEMLLLEVGQKAHSLTWDLRIAGTMATYDKRIFDPSFYRPRREHKTTTKRYDKPMSRTITAKTITIQKAMEELKKNGFSASMRRVIKLVEDGEVSGRLSKGRVSISSLEAWMGTHVPKGASFITGF